VHDPSLDLPWIFDDLARAVMFCDHAPRRSQGLG